MSHAPVSNPTLHPSHDVDTARRLALRTTLSALGAVAVGLVGCATTPASPGDDDAATLARSDWARASLLAPDGVWEHHVFPQRRPTRYTAGWHQGRAALHADSDAGTSAVRMRLRVPAAELGTLRWSWWVDALDERYDPRQRDSDDAVVRVLLTFEGGRERWSARDHSLSELARLVTGEPLPDATLMYLWDARLPVGTVIEHPATGRIRKLVVCSGPADLGRWVDLERDVLADMAHCFGETPQALTGVGLMTDANNTGSRARAWYGPLALTRRRS